jgi:1,4-dihydroxy-2-naphthoate octaprenyltransferase
LKKWLVITRPAFLILPVVLVFLGSAVAWYDGSFNWGYALLALLGLLLTHASVNTLNDYFDYRSGIDLNTQRTPFSGGSGALPGKLLTPKQALWYGILLLVLAVPIGLYFAVVSGWQILPLLVIAALLIILYTPLILKMGWAEWSPGLGLGLLPILGVYFIYTGHYTLTAFLAAVPSGLFVHNLLLLNEFPDYEADKKAGRRSLPIVFGLGKAGIVYSAFTILVYVWIALIVVLSLILGKDFMPPYCLLALLTLPLAVKAIKGSRQFHDMRQLIPAMAANVMLIMLTQLLLGVGYILGRAL